MIKLSFFKKSRVFIVFFGYKRVLFFPIIKNFTILNYYIFRLYNDVLAIELLKIGDIS